MLVPGTTLSRYVVEGPIGAGGMGAVYRARDTHLDRSVALKVLSDGAGGLPDSEARERLVREARAAAALSHPNAVAIYDAGDSEHGPFIVMELVEGETLRSAISKGASSDDVIAWMKMAALALAEAHQRGIIHRDIKPENLMVRPDGIAKVLDFGIARQGGKSTDPSAPTQAALPTLTGTGVSVGTPQYMAPEQIKGKKLDGRADQFAWGVTAYEALTGRLPWQAQNGALGVVASILEEEPALVSELRPEIPPHVAQVIARALAKRPEDRFGNMRELVAALEGVELDLPKGSRPQVVQQPPPPPRAAAQAVGVAETRFSEATVKAVIGKALAFEQQGGYSRSEIAQAASELGISSDALEQATNAIRAERGARLTLAREEEIRARILARRRKGFFSHLIPYIGVNLIILMPALMKDMEGKVWALFVPAIAWGIGLAIHAMGAFSKTVETSEIRKEIEREDRAIARDAERRAALAKKLEKSARRDRLKSNAVELGSAIEDGVASILDLAAEKIRAGSQRPPGNEVMDPTQRVRVQPAPGPVTEAALREAEAEAEAQASRRRARR